ncbi:MAG: S8 family serine peptidase, partial [Clostridia bacterium]|nr:S8 family serine peptidase [Clostridia bacterium]
EIDDYIMTERRLYAENQAEFYAELQQDYAKIKGLQAVRDNKTLFLSKYAPMIRAELSSSEIKTLAQDPRVQGIYYSPEVKVEEEGNISVPLIRANYTRDTLGYTGSGIKIGLLEAYGFPDTTLDYFAETNIIYESDIGNVIDAHANMVAAIMIASESTVNGVTYKGIVPDATLYATYINGTDWRARAEWLLSQGVHVINMSAGIRSNGVEGAYDGNAMWLDHIALNHSVHFVKSAGNNGNKVTSPGLAYNAITVGAIDDNNTATHSDDERYDRSSYKEASGEQIIPTNKPDLVAPGVEILSAAANFENTAVNTGTSLSAPHVTAVIAQLCQARPALKVAQDVVKAILTASVSHSSIAYETSDTDAYDKYGAGVVDAYSSYYTAINGRYVSGSFGANSGNGAEKSYTFNVSSSDSKIRVSLSWLKYIVLAGTHTTANANNHPLADLDLLVYAPNGTLVEYAVSVYNNTEIVEFEPANTGTYRIVVRQTRQSERAVYFGLAWW